MPVKRKSMPETAATQQSSWTQPNMTMHQMPMANAFGMVMKNFGTLLLIIAAFLIGMLWTEVRDLKKGIGTGTTAATTTTGTTAATTPAAASPTITKDQINKFLTGSDWIHFGDANRKIAFVEVSDPSCPFCHLAGGEDPELNKTSGGQFLLKSQSGSYVAPVPEMRKLVDSGQASFTWLYYPGHGNGELGTLALYCANEKGKFWEAHDLLMSNAGYTLMNTTVQNDKTKSGQVADFLKSVENPTDMKNCIDSGKYTDRLTSDASMATSLGMTGTPLFFVNNTAFPGAYNWTDMSSATQTTWQ